MLKFRLDNAPKLKGFGIYHAEKTWNIRKDNTYYGPTIAVHIGTKIFRFYWVIKNA